jgi:hypothetical protein
VSVVFLFHQLVSRDLEGHRVLLQLLLVLLDVEVVLGQEPFLLDITLMPLGGCLGLFVELALLLLEHDHIVGGDTLVLLLDLAVALHLGELILGLRVLVLLRHSLGLLSWSRKIPQARCTTERDCRQPWGSPGTSVTSE